MPATVEKKEGTLNLRKIAFEREKEVIAPGHKLCPGCGITVIGMLIASATKKIMNR